MTRHNPTKQEARKMMDIKRKPEIEQMLKDALTKMDAYKYRALFDRLKGEG